MEIPTVCATCRQEGGASNFDEFDTVPLPEDGLIKLMCNKGHFSYIVVQDDKFELLSELAVQAIVDDYYREAVASFSTSLERLYEFYLRVLWRSKGRSKYESDQLWNHMSSSSERQFGAFISCYFTEHGIMPKVLSQNFIRFRNDVIHKGRFPSRKEAIEFGQAAFDVANPLIAKLLEPAYQEARRAVVYDNLRQGYELARQAGAQASTFSIATPFSMTSRPQYRTILELVEAQAKRPNVKKLRFEANKLIEQMIRASQGAPPQDV